MSTRIVRILKVATAAFFVACAPALAQQVPDHAVPIGRGSAATGFKFATPVANGIMASPSASGDPAFATSFGLGGALQGGEVISAYNGNIVLRGNGVQEIYVNQIDGATSITGAGVVGATSSTSGTIVTDASLVANGTARTSYSPPRYGKTTGGWAEVSLFAGTDLVIGTAINAPLIFGSNAAERGRLLASGTWQFSTPMTGTTLALGGALIGGSLSTTGTGANAVIASKQSDGASSTTGAAGFEAWSDSADLLLLGNGTARTTVRYGLTTGGSGEITLATGSALLFGTQPNAPIVIGTNNTERLRILQGLSVGTTSDPGAGLIYLNSASFLMRNKTSWSNGAAAQTATLTNGPTAGNPTKWIPVDDNGTTRYIPAW